MNFCDVISLEHGASFVVVDITKGKEFVNEL